MSRHLSDRRAIAALLLGATCIGFAPILVRVSGLSPAASAFWRMLLAALLFTPLALRHRSQWKALRPGWRWGWLAGVFFALDLAVWHWSIELTTPANATLEANFAGVWVSLVGWRWFGERFGPRFVVGGVLAGLGAALLLGVSFEASPTRALGDVLGLVTSLFYAGYLLVAKRLREGWSTVLVMTASAWASAAVLGPLALLSPGAAVPSSVQQWGVVLGLALIVHALGQGLIIFALARLPASFSAVSLLVQPVVAAALGWVALGIALGPWEILGGGVVLTGVVLARLGTGAPAAPRVTEEPARA